MNTPNQPAKICQSCGMPMESTDMFGKNADGTANDDYCQYCYPSGAFNNPNETLQEMIDTCVPFMVQQGFKEEEARQLMQNTLPNLKRWKK